MVAERLGISVHTVHRHVANLSAKLDAHGMPALVRYAVEHGLVRSSSVAAPGSPARRVPATGPIGAEGGPAPGGSRRGEAQM